MGSNVNNQESKKKQLKHNTTINSRYRSLHSRVGRTSLIELSRLNLQNNNRVFAKLEYENPGGSHYDRVYVALLKYLEKTGEIVPGQTHLVETTTGNAGASFALVAAQQGYKCTVIIPDDVSMARKRQILDHGAELILSPPREYVYGVIKRLHKFLVEKKLDWKAGRLVCVNHSKQRASVKAVAKIADEIKTVLERKDCIPDFIILGCGNATTILGIGGRIKKLSPTTKCIAFDPFEAPVAYERKFPGLYKRLYGSLPDSGLHRMLGTGGWGVVFENVKNPKFLSIIDDVKLVRDEEMLAAQNLLAKHERLFPGHSSAGAVSVACRLAKKVKNCVMVVIFYDELTFYPDANEVKLYL